MGERGMATTSSPRPSPVISHIFYRLLLCGAVLMRRDARRFFRSSSPPIPLYFRPNGRRMGGDGWTNGPIRHVYMLYLFLIIMRGGSRWGTIGRRFPSRLSLLNIVGDLTFFALQKFTLFYQVKHLLSIPILFTSINFLQSTHALLNRLVIFLPRTIATPCCCKGPEVSSSKKSVPFLLSKCAFE